MHDWSIEITHRTNLHGVAGSCLQCFAITVDIQQDAPFAQVGGVAQASPPIGLRLEAQWDNYLRIALGGLDFLWWRKAAVAHAFAPVIGQLDIIAAAVG